MKGTALLLCAITLAQAAQPQLTLSGKVCHCNAQEAPGVCSRYGSDNELIVHENCNQFYKCAHGSPVAFFCPGTTLYNPIAEKCDWPQNVQCGERPIVDAPEPENESINDGQDNDASDNGNPSICNCNPEEAPALCAASRSDGVMVAHENCNQFYQCAQGVPVAMFCNSNLLYNPYTEQCDWPQNVNCAGRPIVEIESVGDNNADIDCAGDDNGSGNGDTENSCNCNPAEAPEICGASGSDGVLVAHEKCNQFYKCAHGVPVTFSCYGNLLYNPYTEQCDWPQNVDCGDRYCDETGSGVEDSGGSGSNNDGNANDNGSSGNGGSGTDNGGGTCNCNPGEAPGICAADGSDGVLVAHEYCNQFYKCDNGAPITLICFGNLVYNPYTEQCDWPENVDCGGKPIGEIDVGGGDNDGSDNGGVDNGAGDNGIGDNGGGDNGVSTCNCNPGEAPGICAADGSDGVLIAHEHCNQFYKCANGEPVTLNCLGNLVYNPYTEQCDWPENVACGDKPIVDIDGGGEDNGGSDNGGGDNGGDDNGGGDNGAGDNGGGDTGGSTCNCNPGEAPGICAADGSDGVLVAHEHCNQFYKCANGEPVTLNCLGNLVYNPYTEQCDWPENVACGDKPIVDIDGGSEDNGGSDNGGGDNGGDDNGGVDNGAGDNGGGDTGGSTCNCNPGEAPGICAAEGSEGVLIAHENCNQYYKCVNSESVTLSCNGNLLYNPYTEQCDWPVNVQCGDRPIVEIEAGSENDNNGSSNDNENTEEDCKESNSNNNCDCSDEVVNICSTEGTDNFFYATHENCNQFYQCAQGVPVAFFCPGNLLYNPNTHRCDWPELVDCGDRPIVENEGGNNDKDDDDSGESDEDSDDTDTPATCNCNPEEAPSICNVTGSDGTNVAHQYCNAFYTCANGVPVTLYCSGNLLYNPYTGRCDWPNNVECGDRPINPVEPGPGEDDKDEESEEIEGAYDPNQAPAICASSDSDGVLVAHENCNQYYICTHGEPLPVNCPSNLLYNPVIRDCDWPDNVDCGDRIVPGSGGGGGPCACDAREAPSICAGQGSNGKLIAHENCGQYYVCVDGSPVARSCPPSLFYDPHTEQCLWAAAVACEGRAIGSVSVYSSLNKHLPARRGIL